MAAQLKWSEDPIVLLDNAVLPAVWQGQTLIAQALLAGDAPLENVDLSVFEKASSMLRRGASDMLAARSIRVNIEELAPLHRASETLTHLAKALKTALAEPLSQEQAKSLLAQIDEQMLPAVHAGLDRFRSIYIGYTQQQHQLHASRAREAVEGLDRISKQIFFISINASVEAARVGDAGRGFTQISTDIRALSQSAQDATRGLSEVVNDGERAA